MSLSKVLDVARGELGVTENPPGSNRVKYWDSYDPKMQGQPWCVAFQWWCFWKAGESSAFFGGAKTASCGKLLRFFKENYQSVPVQDIAIGDLAFYNFSGSISPEHCGLITHVERSHSSILYVKSIEGNTTTTGGSEDNGGVVAEKVRYPCNIVGVARPKYKLDDPQPVEDVTGHWYTPAVEWAREKGLIKNYPDGSFKPDQPITRAEACVMFERFYQLLWEDDLR